ncbi:MAG TPA: Ig-like domain-containing protein, partial [Pseudogracilibacillus sp.]|nr:Ig-like domain-containing protein [Pseudogracilibacillus sp.]
MDKRISLLFIFLLFFQTISNGFIAPAQIKAEGSKQSIFTDISFTDEDGNEVNVEESDGNSAITMQIGWSTDGVDIKAEDSESLPLPEGLQIKEEQQGALKAGDAEIGIFHALDDTLTVTFNEAAEAHEEAAGTFEITAFTKNDEIDKDESAEGKENDKETK